MILLHCDGGNLVNVPNESRCLPLPSGCFSVEELEVGMSAEKIYSIDYEDVERFSEISGDWNPAHFATVSVIGY